MPGGGTFPLLPQSVFPCLIFQASEFSTAVLRNGASPSLVTVTAAPPAAASAPRSPRLFKPAATGDTTGSMTPTTPMSRGVAYSALPPSPTALAAAVLTMATTPSSSPAHPRPPPSGLRPQLHHLAPPLPPAAPLSRLAVAVMDLRLPFGDSVVARAGAVLRAVLGRLVPSSIRGTPSACLRGGLQG